MELIEPLHGNCPQLFRLDMQISATQKKHVHCSNDFLIGLEEIKKFNDQRIEISISSVLHGHCTCKYVIPLFFVHKHKVSYLKKC